MTYRFKAAHAANTAWNASEVESTNLGSEITGLKSGIDIMSDEEKLFNASIPGTTETVTFSNDKPASVVHTANNSAVRTDTFVWTDTMVTETRTLANGKYVTLATNLETLVTVISEIQEAA